MRAPFQIVAVPYRKNPMQFCVLRRSDSGLWQFIAGGGEDAETPVEAAVREILEEVGMKADNIIELVSMAYVPVDVIAKRHRDHWAKGLYVLPEYSFAFECSHDIELSREHLEYDWVSYDEALTRLAWDSNKTALYELNCRLSVER